MACTYTVTVVTPVRDTPIPVFQRSFASLKRQSFGFDKIQWVVVLHQCSPLYKEQISGLLGGYPNITLAAEESPGSALSDARNRTLDLAEGKWLFFLDSDDELKADVIRETVAHMEASDADTGVFGAELDYNGFRVTSLPDAESGEAVVLSRGDERIGKGLCEYGLYLWTRCYRRRFLSENDIRFRPYMDFGEDLFFNIDATAAAGKVLILPKLSGYTHYLTGGMGTRYAKRIGAGEGTKLSGEFIAGYALLLDGLYEAGRKAALALDNVIWYQIWNYGRPFLYAKGADKRLFRDALSPLLQKLRPPRMLSADRQKQAEGICRRIMEQTCSRHALPYLISVIIPVHNGEAYLSECLEALQKQTWKHLEILVVDDGSTDATARIAEDFAKRDDRIRVIRKRVCQKQFLARLTGFEEARGDYMISVDGDDRCSEDYVESLLLAACESGADLVVGDHVLYFTQRTVFRNLAMGRMEDRKYLVPQDMEMEFYAPVDINDYRYDQSLVAVWSKLIRRDLMERSLPTFRAVTFPMSFFEDVFYSGVFYRLSRRSVFTNHGTYYYRRHSASETSEDLIQGLERNVRGQLEMIVQLRWLLRQTDAGKEKTDRFEAWRDSLWKVMESRYVVYIRKEADE
jgi:glycosyltransferase involved in cell wall biosynthesis